MKDAIRYTITVSAVVERVQTAGKEWTTVSHEVIEGSEKTKPVMGYTPEIEKTVQREIKVYEQTVDSLDMAALVAVVNSTTQIR